MPIPAATFLTTRPGPTTPPGLYIGPGGERALNAGAPAPTAFNTWPLEVTVTCRPYPGDCHAGASVITVRVASEVALPLLPDVLGSGRPAFALDATHTVPVGQFQEVG